MVVIDKFKIKEIMAKNKIKNFSELAKMLGISKNQLSKFLKVSPLEILKEDNNAKI